MRGGAGHPAEGALGMQCSHQFQTAAPGSKGTPGHSHAPCPTAKPREGARLATTLLSPHLPGLGLLDPSHDCLPCATRGPGVSPCPQKVPVALKQG